MDRADLAFAGLSRHADLIAAGELSSRELVELFLERIDRLDPLLNAFRVVLREQALAQADQADARRRAGDQRPLLGVPIAIKDDLHVAGEVTAYGCDADPQPAARGLRGRAPVRAAGAVIVGKTHVPGADGDGLHGVADVRRHAQPLGRAPDAGRLERRLGGRGRCGARLGRARDRRRRLDPHPRGLLRALRLQGRSAGGSRPRRTSHPHRGMTVFGPITRTVEDAARLADVLKDGGPSYAEAARDVARASCGSRSRSACRRSA